MHKILNESFLLFVRFTDMTFPNKKQVRILFRPQRRTHPKPHSIHAEQLFAKLRCEQRDKLAELPIDLMESVRDEINLYVIPFHRIQPGFS